MNELEALRARVAMLTAYGDPGWLKTQASQAALRAEAASAATANMREAYHKATYRANAAEGRAAQALERAKKAEDRAAELQASLDALAQPLGGTLQPQVGAEVKIERGE